MSKFAKVIGILMILLVITLPISFAQEVRGTVDEEVTQEQENRNIGEDILINIDKYQPNIIKSGLLSKQNVNVFALLSGVPINPSIKIARIKSINAVPVNITTKPDGSKVSIGGISFRAPKREELSYDNMGYLVVPIKKMKEEEMPDDIKIAVNARIYFDISEALLYSEFKDVLAEEKEEDWLKAGNQHQFFGGYVRADEIREGKASFVFYDTDKNKISSFSLKEGETKWVNSYSRLTRTLVGSGYTGLFDNFRIKLDELTKASTKIRLLIYKDNKIWDLVLSKGSSLYDGSDWYVDDIKNIGNGEYTVTLKKKGINIFEKRTLSWKTKAKVNDVSEIVVPKSNEKYLREAINSYEKVISDYGDENGIKDLKIKAKQKIAKLYEDLEEYSNALIAYNWLLENDPNSINRGSYEVNIARVNTALNNEYQGTNIEKPIVENSVNVDVRLIGVIEVSEKDRPKAYLKVGGEVKKETGYLEGESVEGGWKIESIEQNRVVLKYDGDKPVRETLILNQEKVFYEKNNKDNAYSKIELTNIDLKLEARITISPQIEEAMTEANFNLHLTIEKKPKLEKFVGNLDNAIKKTEKLIEKLDKIISNTEKIHNYWTKFCYITFGTLWVKNLVTGFFGSAGVARKRVAERWHDKYESSGEASKGVSYDQYILKNENRAAYETDLKNTEKILGEIKSGDYKKDETVNKFNAASDATKADLYESRKIFESNKDENWQDYLNTELNANEEQIYRTIPKSLEELKKDSEIKNLVQDYTGNLDNEQDFNKNKEVISSIWVREKRGDGREKIVDTFKTAESNSEWYKSKGIVIDNYINSVQNIGKDVSIATTSKSYISNDGKTLYDLSMGIREINPPVTSKDNLKVGDIITLRDNTQVKVSNENEVQARHEKQTSVYQEGRNKGKIEYYSIDAWNYAQVEYASSGAIKNVNVYKRTNPNTNLGASNDLYQRTLSEMIKDFREIPEKEKSAEQNNLLKELGGLQSRIDNCNRKLEFKTWKKGDVNCEGYSIVDKAPIVSGSQCTDFMSPTDCGLLFNACDPVICPSTRCNLGGRWTVSNVVETGIVGSTVLCAPNFGVPPEGVAVPICITGILAGLKNIQSILKGFNECLKSQKVKGESVGICDRIRSIYICEMLWKEGIAIFNVNNGLLGLLADKIGGKVEGGAEYNNFKQSLENSAGSVGYFTQSYAKNVFAGYSGKSLGEIGSEICRSAIYGNVPGIGNFFEQALRPESPPQFFAFFDEAPYQDVLEKQESIYTVFYHIYAGENEDIIYNVYLQKVDENEQVMSGFGRVYLVSNQRLDKGGFADQNVEKVLFSGYNQICVETRSSLKGVNKECGFGKVTTDFSVNYLNDIYTGYEATKKISSKEECVSESGRITSLEYAKGGVTGFNAATIPEAAVGSVSTGLLNTGVVRTCSGYDPDVGSGKDEWRPVGDCGKDENGRNLGQCYVYATALNNLIKDTVRETAVSDELLKKQATDVLTRIVGQVDCTSVIKIEELKQETSVNNILKGIKKYEEQILNCNEINNLQKAQMQFNIGEAYEEVAERVRTGGVITTSTEEKTNNIIDVINNKEDELGPTELSLPIEEKEPLSDTTPPTTTINIEGTKGNNDWYTSNVQITLECEDGLGINLERDFGIKGIGCDKIYYSLDDQSEQIYSNPFEISNEGRFKLSYHSSDKSNNIEETQIKEIKIDKTKPQLSMDYGSSKQASSTDTFSSTPQYPSITIISVDANDDLSKIKEINVMDVNNQKILITCFSSPCIYSQQILLEPKGVYTFRATAYDNAGNFGVISKQITVT